MVTLEHKSNACRRYVMFHFSPCCQGVSMANRQNQRPDATKKMIMETIDIIKETAVLLATKKPELRFFWSMEESDQIPGTLQYTEDRHGGSLQSGMLVANSFGVPQNRKRYWAGQGWAPKFFETHSRNCITMSAYLQADEWDAKKVPRNVKNAVKNLRARLENGKHGDLRCKMLTFQMSTIGLMHPTRSPAHCLARKTVSTSRTWARSWQYRSAQKGSKH